MRRLSLFASCSADLPVLLGSSNASLGILLLLPGASGGATEQVAAWRLNLFEIKIVVYGFLAPYTKCGPRHRGKPLRVDVVIALLARPETAFLDATERRTDVSKLVRFTVEVTNRECAFGSRLDLFHLIGASLNRNPLAVARVKRSSSATFAVRIA